MLTPELRARLVVARDLLLRHGQQPTLNLATDCLAALDGIAGSRLALSRKAAEYAEQLRSTSNAPWNVASIDRLITLADDIARQATST